MTILNSFLHPRYSLRTLFVLTTLFALWLGWEMKFVRDRQDYLAHIHARGGETIYADDAEQLRLSGVVFPPTIPVWRRWLGDRPVVHPGLPINEMISPIWDDEQDKAYFEKQKRLFPEVDPLWGLEHW